MQTSLTIAMAPPPRSGNAAQSTPNFLFAWALIIAVAAMLCAKFCLRRFKRRPGALRATAIVGIMLGLALGFWARAHSPHMGFGEMMTKMDSYMINEPAYYAFMGVAALLVLLGAGAFFTSLGTPVPAGAAFPPGVGSSLDQIKKAKELLDAGAITAPEFEKIKKTALDG